jgi:hypothetical protein
MDVPAEVASKFPLAIIVMVFSAGLLFTALLPFDIMSYDFGNGLSLPSFQNASNTGIFIENSYQPLVNMKYLSDFPNGLIKILLFSLVPGVFFLFSQDWFDWLNKQPLHGRIKNYLEKKGKFHRLPDISVARNIRFVRWLKEKDYLNYLDVITSLRFVPIGCFYVLETLTLFTIFLVLAVSIMKWAVSTLVWWVLVFILFALITYLLMLMSESYVNRRIKDIYNTFENESKQIEIGLFE